MSARDLLGSQGYFLAAIDLPSEVRACVEERDWPALDRAVQTLTHPGGVIFDELARYEKFSQIEFIISIRSSREFPDDDGIWHDDGSRVLAFSLSLTLSPGEIEGGKLELRRRGEVAAREIPTPDYGTMIVFATGVSGFEHKINRVARGERIIIAGWCT